MNYNDWWFTYWCLWLAQFPEGLLAWFHNQFQKLFWHQKVWRLHRLSSVNPVFTVNNWKVLCCVFFFVSIIHCCFSVPISNTVGIFNFICRIFALAFALHQMSWNSTSSPTAMELNELTSSCKKFGSNSSSSCQVIFLIDNNELPRGALGTALAKAESKL